jgi:hypothetical protein
MSAPIRIQAAGGVAIEDGRNNAVFVVGATVPSDGTAGFVTGCLFIHTDGGAGTAFYCNVGTDTSCNFDAVSVA